MLEICQNAAGSTDIVTDRRVHDGLSWTPSSHTCAISSADLFITLDGKYDESSPTRRSVEGLRSKTLKLLEYGYWDYLFELHDEPSWTPSHHTCAISSTALFITLDGRYDGSSQEQRSVEGLFSKTLEL